MANTFTLIQSVLITGSNSATVTFSNIPQTYTDLKLLMTPRNSRTDGNAGYLNISFNDSTSPFVTRAIYDSGNGGIGAGSDSSNTISYAVTTSFMGANIFSNGEIYIPNYTGNQYKNFYCDMGAEDTALSNPYGVLMGAIWSNTSAITKIILTSSNGSYAFVPYSNFYLYGINKN